VSNPIGDGRNGTLRVRLYVAGSAPNSMRAIANANAMCAKHFVNHELEVVDLMVEPERAAGDRIVVTPTLVKLSPAPEQRIIGDLSDGDRLLAALGGARK
jgi:circadian clock protein KaiB